MSMQTNSWFWRLWRKLALCFHERLSSHLQLTTPALYGVPGAVNEPLGRKVSAMQWPLNDHYPASTDHNNGATRVEVELITDFPPHEMDDPSLRITHYPSNRLH